jgi:hypothetical protein
MTMMMMLPPPFLSSQLLSLSLLLCVALSNQKCVVLLVDRCVPISPSPLYIIKKLFENIILHLNYSLGLVYKKKLLFRFIVELMYFFFLVFNGAEAQKKKLHRD